MLFTCNTHVFLPHWTNMQVEVEMCDSDHSVCFIVNSQTIHMNIVLTPHRHVGINIAKMTIGEIRWGTSKEEKRTIDA